LAEPWQLRSRGHQAPLRVCPCGARPRRCPRVSSNQERPTLRAPRGSPERCIRVGELEKPLSAFPSPRSLADWEGVSSLFCGVPGRQVAAVVSHGVAPLQGAGAVMARLPGVRKASRPGYPCSTPSGQRNQTYAGVLRGSPIHVSLLGSRGIRHAQAFRVPRAERVFERRRRETGHTQGFREGVPARWKIWRSEGLA